MTPGDYETRAISLLEQARSATTDELVTIKLSLRSLVQSACSHSAGAKHEPVSFNVPIRHRKQRKLVRGDREDGQLT